MLVKSCLHGLLSILLKVPRTVHVHATPQDVAAFLPGAGGMPALLALPEPSPGHQATHLLLDARLRLGNGCGSGAKLLGATAAATAQANGAATGLAEKPLRAGLGQPRAGGQQQQPWPSSSGAVLLEVAELLESSLVGAGLPPRPGAHRTQSFPSFSAGCLRLAGASTAAAAGASGMAACSHKYQEIRGGLELTANGAAAVNAAEAAEAAEVGNPHMLYLEVEDGFATLIWLARCVHGAHKNL